jgi:Calcineurin-like phosphoesterase
VGKRLAALALVLSAAVACGPNLPPRAGPAAPTALPDGPIVVLGDTQRTFWGERLIGREQNEMARRELIAKIAREERPAFMVHLGDMVVAGDADEWQYFDRLMSPITARQIPILPVLGNHDYWGDDRIALRHALRRFPELAENGRYAGQHRGLGFIWLNSNLVGAAAREQAQWFGARLDAFDRDSSIRAVLVFSHHPPYTNGKHRYGEESAHIRAELLPSFDHARKTAAMMSGHVHGYERFVVNEKTFVVTGGAGGPRVEYEVGNDAHPAPAYVTRDGRPRAFNYVVVADRGERLDFTVKCLAIDAVCTDGILERFSVALP